MDDSYHASISHCMQIIGASANVQGSPSALAYPSSSFMVLASIVLACALVVWPSLRPRKQCRTGGHVAKEPHTKQAKVSLECSHLDRLDSVAIDSVAKKRKMGHRCDNEYDLSAFFCCMGRARDVDPEPEVQELGIAEVRRAGVPTDDAEHVAKLATIVGASGVEPLSDPLTLWRFLRARESDIDAAAAMYRETMTWRATFSILAAMAAHGCGEEYFRDGSRASATPTQWNWQRSTVLPEAAFVQRFGFWGRLDCLQDEAPVAVWRLGAADITGYAREDGLLDVLMKGFAAHLEDLLQTSRAASLRQQRLIRCRVIIDASGLNMSVLRQSKMMKTLIGMGKRYFPEVSASITVLRAPKVFSYIYAAAQPLLTPVMRRKVCILGDHFDAGLWDHCGLSRNSLPEFLGGQTGDNQVCSCEKVPTGLNFRALFATAPH